MLDRCGLARTVGSAAVTTGNQPCFSSVHGATARRLKGWRSNPAGGTGHGHRVADA